jgi:CheY-like chemotaxis protein
MLDTAHIPARRVLVIDDDDDICDTLRELLEEHGHAVLCASNGHEALDVLHAASPLPDVILLDLMMPVMNGWEFRGCQKKDPALATIPVVVITATGSARERAGLMGVDEILLKPIHLDQLLAVIAGVTASEPHLH